MKTKRYLYSLLLAGLAIGLPASAKTYTLNECLTEAVNNNMKLRNANNQIAISAEQRKEALTKYFPTITAEGGGFMSNRSLVQMNVMGMGLNYVKNGIVAGVTAMQPVFAGGLIVNSNKLAKVGEESAQLTRGLSENEIRLATEQYYWQIVMLKEKLVTLDQLDKQLESVRKDAQAAVDAGIRNRNDVLQVQLRQNEVKTSRIQVQNAESTVKDMLAQIMGHPNEDIDISEGLGSTSAKDMKSSSSKDSNRKNDLATVYSLPENPQQFYQAPESCLGQTNEYQLLGKQVEAGKLAYKMAVGKNLPTVAIGGGYIYNNVMDKSQNNLVGMVTVSVPISSWWGGSHDMKRQKIQVENALNDKQNQGQMLIIKMRKAWNDMNDAYKQVAIAQQSIATSEENLRLNTDYYHAGTATITDLLNAQTLYQQSRDKYVESYTDYEVKKRSYLQATGR